MLRRELLTLPTRLQRTEKTTSSTAAIFLRKGVSMATRKRNRNNSNPDGPPLSSADRQMPQKKPRRGATKEAMAHDAAVEGNNDSVDRATFPVRTVSPWKFGPHVSAAGGVENAVLNAAKIG